MIQQKLAAEISQSINCSANAGADSKANAWCEQAYSFPFMTNNMERKISRLYSSFPLNWPIIW